MLLRESTDLWVQLLSSCEQNSTVVWNWWWWLQEHGLKAFKSLSDFPNELQREREWDLLYADIITEFNNWMAWCSGPDKCLLWGNYGLFAKQTLRRQHKVLDQLLLFCSLYTQMYQSGQSRPKKYMKPPSNKLEIKLMFSQLTSKIIEFHVDFTAISH